MKNTNDLDHDGTRWSPLRGESPEQCFHRWGAVAIYRAGLNGSGDDVYMVELEDGWHYAHANYNSIYCAAFGHHFTSGKAAWLAHQMDIAKGVVTNARNALEVAKEAFNAAESAYLEETQQNMLSRVSSSTRRREDSHSRQT